MKTKLLRYDTSSALPVEMVPDAAGEWVSAYDALARIAKLDAEVERLRAELSPPPLSPPPPFADVERLAAQPVIECWHPDFMRAVLAKVARLREGRTLSSVVTECHATALAHGWWDADTPVNIPEKLALIHSEISEALEDYRNAPLNLQVLINDDKGKPIGFPSELADVVIRVFDLAGWLQIDLSTAIAVKMEYNKSRPYRHGGKAC